MVKEEDRSCACGQKTPRNISPQEAIKFVAESSGVIVRDSNRSFELTLTGPVHELDTCQQITIAQLRELAFVRGFINDRQVTRTGRDRLAETAAGDVHRVASDKITPGPRTAVDLAICTIN